MRPLLVIILIVAALFLLKKWVLDKEPAGAESAITTPASRSASSALPVDIYVATLVPQSNVAYSTGTVVPNEEVELRSEVNGRIVDLRINEGSYVRKGQLIAKLNDDELRAQLKKVEFEEQLAAQTEARQKRLLEINAISKEEYDMAVTRVNTLSADKELLKAQLEKTSVVAPFSGTIGLKNISIGAYLTPATSIATLVQTHPVKIDFSLPEKYANKIQPKREVIFNTDGSQEKKTATVVAVDPKIDEDLRTLRVRAQTGNRDGKLLPGMFVRVEVPLGEESSIMIPTEAVIPILKGKKVFVVEGGQAVEKRIETGLRTDTHIQVENGLLPGDSVIVSALMTVKPNMEVAVRNLIK